MDHTPALPITEQEAAIIEMSRRLARKLVCQLSDRGVLPADITIGFAYALHDAASELTGSPVAAVEWMRTAADLMERQVMEGAHATAH